MEVNDVLYTFNASSKEVEEELRAKMCPCDCCGKPGFIAITGDEYCMECGNEIGLCKECAKKLVKDINSFIKRKEKTQNDLS